jgi:hypothetical protein
MLWQKKEQSTLNIPDVKVKKIPDEFYGGVNPVIQFKKVEKEVIIGDKPTDIVSPSEKKLLDKQSHAGAGESLHPATLMSNKKFLSISVIVLFVVVLAIAGVYYFYQYKNQKQNIVVTPPAIEEPIIETPLIIEESAPTSTEEIETSQNEAEVEAAISFPSSIVSLGFDGDGDGVSDSSEELFGTDATSPDTDEDKYPDGLELYHLYNPKGFAPMKLIEAGQVKEFENPNFGYKLYYPRDWASGNVDVDYKDMLFTSLNGESVEVRVVEKDPNQSFADWFAKWAPQENFSELKEFDSVFNVQGFSRKDNLVYYFFDDRYVYVILYRVMDGSTIANYDVVIKMMARSFQIKGAEIAEQPAQIIEENPSLELQQTQGESEGAI